MVNPTGVIPLGGNATITCKTEHLNADFYLWKKRSCAYEFEPVEKTVHVFPVRNAKYEDGLIYLCAYCFYGATGHKCSSYSDEVNITIRGECWESVASGVGQVGCWLKDMWPQKSHLTKPDSEPSLLGIQALFKAS